MNESRQKETEQEKGQKRGREVESRMVISMIYACIQTEQRSAATRRTQRVGWHQSDTSGGKRKREKTQLGWQGKETRDEIQGGGSGKCMGARQYGDVSTLKVRRQHFPSVRQPFCQVHRDRTEPVPASQPAHDEGHIYYMPCSHKTCSRPRWQGLESAFKESEVFSSTEKGNTLRRLSSNEPGC